MNHPLLRLTSISVTPLSLCGSLAAQRLVGYAPGGFVDEFASPLGGACSGPSDPVFTITLGGTLCFLALPGFGGGISGDVGVDTLSDTYWVTDGFSLAEYASSTSVTPGLPIAVYNGAYGALVPPLTGLGIDTTGGLIWATDGLTCQAFTKPATGGLCLPPLAPLASFACRVTPGVPVTDVEWDATTGLLWFVDATGSVFSRNTLGALVNGAWASSVCLPFGPPKQGLAVDPAAGALGSALNPLVYTAKTNTISYDEYSIGPATLSGKVYDTAALCLPAPGPLNGLAAVHRPNHYGTSSICIPSPNLEINTVGQSVGGNAAFEITVSGAPVTALAVLLYAFAPSCPSVAIPFHGCTLDFWLSPGVFQSAAMPPLAGGASAFPVPIPTSWVGLSVYVQIGVVDPFPLLVDLTDALEIIVTDP
jgi:hypothetical protein